MHRDVMACEQSPLVHPMPYSGRVPERERLELINALFDMFLQLLGLDCAFLEIPILSLVHADRCSVARDCQVGGNAVQLSQPSSKIF